MYRAPLKDLKFCLDAVVGDSQLALCPAFPEYGDELRDSVLAEAGKFAETVLDPLYRSGDTEGARWTQGGVQMPRGYRDAYARFVASGWPSLRSRTDRGGQGMPATLGTAVEELWASSNLAFKLCPMLTQGATEAIEHAGSESQKHLYLPKMVRGDWSGTMNLTEPQAGSDLGQIRVRAVAEGDHFRIWGQKIFITYGDHDLTENVIHLVLARIDGAPPGTRGISLFIVPKIIVNADSSLGTPNDVRCLSIERKLGIHASPTCVMNYGQSEGAVGYLVGEANRGLEYMFVMMNAARLSVGLEGYAVAERAFQQAREWARQRVQGRVTGSRDLKGAQIIQHPDVRRMLLLMSSQIDAMRSLALYTALQLDLSRHHPGAAARDNALARGELLIPVVKAHCTETGVELASLGIQVHGGMGYIEETGIAQALRDVRICTIYEGTTGIQGGDLVSRKIGRDGGAALRALVAEMRHETSGVSVANAALAEIRRETLAAIDALDAAGTHVASLIEKHAPLALAVSVPLARLTGIVVGGWLLTRSAVRAEAKPLSNTGDGEFYAGKLQAARFYAAQVLPQAHALSRLVMQGAATVVDADPARI